MSESTQVVNWQEKIGKLAQATAAAEVVGGKFLSFKSGVLSYNDQVMPGNSLECLIVAYCRERTFYSKPWSPNVVVSPECYAYAKVGEDGELPDMFPHNAIEKPMHESCNGCPMDEWGSDIQGGRGKGCKELRRLAILPLDALKTPEKIFDAEVAYARIPVMSVVKWAAYTHLLAAHKTAPFAVITRLHLMPDARSQFTVNFELKAKISDNDLLGLLYAKHERAMAGIDFPYPKFEEKEEEAKPTGKKSKVG